MRRHNRNPIENHPDYRLHREEIARRLAILDFLGLYVQAKEDGIVDRLKYITESKGFETYHADGWETYITRLLGRCLRHHITDTGAVQKRRRELIYRIERTGTQYAQIPEWKKIITCSGYPYRPPNDMWNAAGRNAVSYWSSRRADPDSEETLFTEEQITNLNNWYTMYENAVSLLECISFSPWYGVEIRYGTPANRRYYRAAPGRYKASEAYQDFKAWKTLSDALLEDEDNIAIIDQMRNFNMRADRVPAPPPEREDTPEVQLLRNRIAEHNEPARVANLDERFRQRLIQRGYVDE